MALRSSARKRWAGRAKAGKGMLGVFPRGGIARAEVNPQEPEFHDGCGVKLRPGFEPIAHRLVLGMGGPAAGEQEIDVE